MWWMRIAWFPLLLASLGLLAGALGQQPGAAPPPAPRPTPRPKPSPPPKADPEATKVLERAIAALSPRELPWVDTKLWQQADLQGFTFQAEGRYLTAPGNRLHLDLQVRLGDTLGKLLVVSDGTTWWERLQVGTSSQVDVNQVDVKKMDLKTVLGTLNSPNMIPEVRTEYFQRLSFTGLEPLLKKIHQQMVVTGQERLTWKGRQVAKLTAVWSEASVKALVGSRPDWPVFLPKRCCLYLDADVGEFPGWPRRIEWWGPGNGPFPETLLLQMEFRDSKLRKPKSEEQYAAKFRFDPGNAKVQDLTKQTTEDAKTRRNQLAAQQGRTRPPR